MNWILKLFFTLNFLTLSTKAQQEYSANSALNCNNNDVTSTEPSSALLYTCNGEVSSCKAFLIFRAQYPYNSVPAIATLTSSDQSEVARINNVTMLTVFANDQEVIVPVTCSCSGRYFHANATYHIQSAHETYFLIAKNTYQGLTTCGSIKRANAYSEFRLQPSMELQVPLRCACPTRRQMVNGTKYLLTYSITWNENVSHISERFDIAAEAVLEANSFSGENPTLFVSTTILLPLTTEPQSSRTIIRNNTLAISPQPSYGDRKGRSKRNISVRCGVAAGFSLLVLFIIIPVIIFLLYKRRTGGAAWNRRDAKAKGIMAVDLLVEIANIDRILKVYQFSEIRKATGNFSPKSRIKGSVYRGVFKGETRAVKKMNVDVSKEVNILNKINHLNLIKLHGFCEHHDCSYLVFEYTENGSLKEWLSRKCGENTKSWTQRIQIAQDVANGLLYLHNFTKPAYVHKDINSSTILLDGNLRAKIANFSLARIAVKGINDSAVTTRVVGTKGYMAPEYMETGSVTPKIDVYAFGVLLLELITGKEAVLIQEGREIFLSAAIIAIMQGENAETKLNSYFLEPSLAENGGILHTLPVVKLSISCLSRDPAYRPSMDEVVSTLLKIQQNVQRGVV